eukprot:m.193108 g.193108  ORF g.193108 m.193108 type:complete len:135 (+) comp15439_c0_seq6:2442-2846(+)
MPGRGTIRWHRTCAATMCVLRCVFVFLVTISHTQIHRLTLTDRPWQMMRDQRAMRDARARLAALTQRAGQLARQQQDKTLATSDPAARIALLARHEQALQRIATLKDQRAAQDRAQARRTADLKARLGAMLLAG